MQLARRQTRRRGIDQLSQVSRSVAEMDQGFSSTEKLSVSVPHVSSDANKLTSNPIAPGEPGTPPALMMTPRKMRPMIVVIFMTENLQKVKFSVTHYFPAMLEPHQNSDSP